MPPSKTPNNLESVSRALRTLSAGNRTLLRASDEQELLREMCKVIIEQGGYPLACVGYTRNDKNKTIQWMECAGMDKEHLQALFPSWSGTVVAKGAFGTAISTGKRSVATHVLTDPAFATSAHAQIMEFATGRGYASVTAFPLQVEGEILGALVMASADPEGFDDEELKLINELADDLAYGIANLRMRIEHRKAQEAIAHLAYHDPLTDLPNRTHLHERLEEAIELAKRQHHSVALLYLQVGQFREINEILGHQAGDQLVQQLAGRLAGAAKHELLAHVGEAAFALLAPNVGADDAATKAQGLLDILDSPVEIAGLTIDPPVSAGIALFPGHGSDAEALLRRANAAVRKARPARGGYAFYSGQEKENTLRLGLMGELRQAIERNELRLYCQPKATIASRQPCGAEALVRWEHPLRGPIGTGEFIKLAEQAALITPLTNWVLNAAFSQGHAWYEAGLARPLSVNLSAHDLHDSRLVERIRNLFSTWGLPPELIQFEITESALMEDPASARDTLAGLKELGVELYIDDFGTGYSSLSYLQKLPVDWIKIDQSFVMPMMTSRDSALIVRSTIELGHNLGLKVIAEGVESQALWDQLGAWGCDVAQGFFVGEPMPADRFNEWETRWFRGPA